MTLPASPVATAPSHPRPALEGPPAFGLVIVGDEILSGKRTDKHLPRLIELLAARGLQLAWAEIVGDAPDRITATLQRIFAGADVVFCCGGIGATPDDHTRQCAARALGEPLVLHPEAEVLIRERIRESAAERGEPYEPQAPDNVHRLNMGVFPASAQIIPNPYNRIPGFACHGPGGAAVYFLPGFPVMAAPMMEWVLDQHYAHLRGAGALREHSVIVHGAMEASLTPLMERIEAEHPAVRVFSLPSVDHPVHGRHIELGVKGPPAAVDAAFAALRAGLAPFASRLGPEVVRP